MKLSRKVELIGNVYHASVDKAATAGLTTAETEAITRLGEPLIAVGGNFVNGGLATDFDLPASSKRFPSQFPVKQLFSRDDSATANDEAVTFETEIALRVSSAMTALLAVDVGTLKDVVVEY
jgi:hypothetical protein